MFDIFFGWRKASKCKKLIKHIQCRLKLLKNKRHSIVRLLRQDIAQLINLGNQDIALRKADQLFRDENTLMVYELLDNFCEFIRLNLSYICKRRDCGDELIDEAVSSLVFASSRCGDLPELRAIRKLFEERFGQIFVRSAADLLPGNLVNQQIKDKLSLKSVSDDSKLKLVDEIAEDYCLRPKILATENKKQDQFVDSLVSPNNENLASSSEDSPQFREDEVVYLDDIEIHEFRLKDSELKDQDKRLFKFKQLVNKSGLCESASDQSSSKSCKTSKVSSRRRLKRRRLISRESLSFKDAECELYYDKPVRKHHKKKQVGERDQCSCLEHSCCCTRKYSEYEVFTYRKETGKRYLTVKTMPPERPRQEGFVRFNSLPLQQHPDHVHPKLPDYDDISARFIALKKHIFAQ